ncbi:trimeric intracellular cation channel family protein [Geminisphaera colitermitum]|uniref:trimeric intracellular cation channel family protein n=1 Tax=Geminisphaera colitermitum TaxID=1148786 RepID=UPI000158CC3E|nr:trimeric intracellular cation channel family protein [Geminisphaera colitermitum]
MLHGHFDLPIWFDLLATFAFALTGALAAIRRHYDIVGIFALSLICGIGGGLIRDGIFISTGPPALVTDARYIETVALACLIGILLAPRVQRFNNIILVADALGLGTYAVFGTQKALGAGIAWPAALLVGVINAAGGGILRDVLSREEPMVFKPGEFYVLVALAGAVTFLGVGTLTGLSATTAAVIGIGMTFSLRMAGLWFNWKTTAPVRTFPPPPPPTPNPKP